jgi:hypothetical protein
MDKKKKNLLEMRKLGFTNKTLSLMTESQVVMILEKIKKSETKEAEQTTKKITKVLPQDPLPPETTLQQAMAIGKKTDGVTKTVDTKKLNLAKDTKSPSDIADDAELTENKKKKKKYNPWAVCTSSVGRKNKKKYEDCVMGVKKKIKEGRNPYEYLIESKMEEIVANARIVDASKIDITKVSILTTVKIKNLKNNMEMKYTIVAENEADLKAGKISIDSPIGKGLVGKAVGDKVEVTVPAGIIPFQIMEITI